MLARAIGARRIVGVWPVGHTRNILDDVQRRGLRHRHRRIVGVRTGLVGVRRGDVVDVAVAAAVAVDLGLRHRMLAV